MLKIGDFSKLSRISIRMLRYYDDNDILKPFKIEEENGYRYYETKQLYWAYQINFLKEIGFGTAMIKEILDHYHESDELKCFFQMQLCELEDKKKDLEDKISKLEKAEKLLKKEDMFMKYAVEIKEVPSVDVVSLRGVIPTYQREDLLWEQLCSELDKNGVDLEVSGDDARAYFFDEGYKEKDVDIEICQIVKRKGKDTGNLTLKHIPKQTCACVTFKGGYHQIAEISLSIGQWIDEHGYALDGANFCIYHVGYGNCRKEEEFITEVCYPIIK